MALGSNRAQGCGGLPSPRLFGMERSLVVSKRLRATRNNQGLPPPLYFFVFFNGKGLGEPVACLQTLPQDVQPNMQD